MATTCSLAGAAKVLDIPSQSTSTSDDLKSSSLQSQDKSSNTDSGYGSSIPSPDRKDDREKVQRPASLPCKAIPFSINNQQEQLLAFKKDISPATLARYREIEPEIERLLWYYLKSSPVLFRRKRAKAPSMAIRLMILGTTETNAREYMVVLCDETLRKRAEHFLLHDEIVKDLRQPSDPTLPSFDVVVKGHPPRPRLAVDDIHVQCAANSSQETLCGTPISFIDQTGMVRHATFGGVIKVVDQDGGFKLYGMTAAHPLLDLDDDIGYYKDEECDENEEDDTDEDAIHDDHEYILAGALHTCPSKPQGQLGKVKMTSNQLSTEDRGYLDWALVEVCNLMPNVLVSKEKHGIPMKQALAKTCEKLSPQSGSRRVTVLTGSKGHQTGELSELPGRINLGPGYCFVDAYLLTLDESSISDGDSGSWVVDTATADVYGHVVATDMFGEIYVVPFIDCLMDIQRCLSARSAELPSNVDFTILRLEGQAEVGDDDLDTKHTTQDLEEDQGFSSQLDADGPRTPPARHDDQSDSGYNSHFISPELSKPEATCSPENSELRDYQMRLMLLEAQSAKRRLMVHRYQCATIPNSSDVSGYNSVETVPLSMSEETSSSRVHISSSSSLQVPSAQMTVSTSESCQPSGFRDRKRIGDADCIDLTPNRKRARAEGMSAIP